MDLIFAWLQRNNISLSGIFGTIALLVVASIVIALIHRALRKWLKPAEARLGLRAEDVGTIIRVITSALCLIVLLIVLDIWGVGIGSFWAVFVSAATIIGAAFVATWAVVSNITADFLLTVWRPFRLGDTVELLPEKLKGRAVDRNMMFTALLEEGGSVLQVPNNLFFQKVFRVGGS